MGKKCLTLLNGRAVILFLLLFCPGCDRFYQTFSTKYPVRFVFTTDKPPYNQIGSAGMFFSVRRSGGNIVATDAVGNTYTMLMSESESRSFLFGLGGLIIGTPFLSDGSSQVYAYDLGCPVCDESGTRLSFSSQGMAVCPDCGTSFNLNNNGFVQESKVSNPRPLYRYQVAVAGNRVTVSN